MSGRIEVKPRSEDEPDIDNVTLEKNSDPILEPDAEEEANSNRDALREETAVSGEMSAEFLHLPLGPFFRS